MQSDSALLRARNAYRIGDYAAAREILEHVLERDGEQPDTHILLGSVLAQQGEIRGAAREFAIAIEQDTDNAEAFNNLGIMYRRLGRLGDAVKAIRSAINLDPERADLRYNLANVFKVAGDIDEAAASYEAAIERDPGFLSAYNNLGNLLAAQGDHIKARAVFERGLYYDPNHPGLHYNIGLALEREGDLEAAEGAFARALRSRPGWVDALNNHGVVLERLGRPEDALRSYQEILRIQPENAIAHNNAAAIQMQRGELDAAVGHLREAIRINPQYERAANNLVRVLGGRDDRDDVPEILAEVVSAFPDRSDFRLAHAQSLADRGELWKAEEELDTLLRLERDDPSALHLLGMVYVRSGREEEGKECFRRLESAAPDHHAHRLELARYHVSEGRYEEAAHELKGYLERVPNDPEGHLLRADILMARGKTDAAVRLLRRLRADYPEHGAVLSHLARAYRLRGDRDEALASADELISLQGNRANPDDLSAINESLAIYEDIVGAYAADHNEAWQRSLEKLGELAREAEETEVKETTEDMEIDELAGLEEDSIPILDFTSGYFEADEEAEEEPEEAPEEPDWSAIAAQQHYPSLLRMAEEERGDRPAPAPSQPQSYPPPDHPGASPWHNPAEPSYAPPPPPPQYQQPPPYQPPPPPQYGPPQTTYNVYQQPASGPAREAAEAGEGPTFIFEAPQPEPQPEPEPQPQAEDATPEEASAEEASPGEAAAEQAPDEEAEAAEPEPEPEPEAEAEDAEPGEGWAAEPDAEPETEPGAEPETEAVGEEGEPGTSPDLAEPAEAEPAEESEEDEWHRRAALFDYLVQLAGDLPEEKSRAFLESDVRLRIETIKSRLTGRPGLRADVERYGMEPPGHDGEPPAVTPKRLRDTFGYIRSLSGYHPDHRIAEAMQTRLEILMSSLE